MTINNGHGVTFLYVKFYNFNTTNGRLSGTTNHAILVNLGDFAE